MSALALQPSFVPAARPARRRHLSLVPPPAAAPARRTPVRRRTAAPAVGPVHVTRRGRLVVTTAVAVALLGAPTAVLAAGAPSAPAAPAAPVVAAVAPAAPAAEHVVLPGETLWSVAEGVAAPGEDVRDVVLRLEQLNGLTTAALQVGQTLVLPAA
jgi:hypothetical protein